MGCSFQLLGAQPNRALQDLCLQYLNAMRQLRSTELEWDSSHRVVLQQGTPIYLVNWLDFIDQNEHFSYIFYWHISYQKNFRKP
mgnify:CR=1 FL=1